MKWKTDVPVIFVTGASGLLGINVCNALLTEGYKVKALVRNKARFKGDLHKNLTLIEAELLSDLSYALYNVDAIIHTAAITKQNLEPDEYLETNFFATAKILNTAISCAVKRFIFVSTANTIGYGSLNNPGHEILPAENIFLRSGYAQSKAKAEAYVLKQKEKIDVIIANPTFLLGAFGSKSGSGKIVLLGYKKKIIFYPTGGKNFVHVTDVANGILQLITKGRNGEKYLLANENLSYKTFFNMLNTITGQKPVMIRIPNVLLMLLGNAGSFLSKWFNIKTSINHVNMKILCISNYYTNAKSIKELQLHYQPVAKAIADTVFFFKKEKIV